MRVKYKGHKKSMPVHLPIGASSRATIKQTLIAAPFVELSDDDAAALIRIDSHNFEIAPEESGTEIHDGSEAKKKNTRKKE